jgi:hypothetical protein
MNVPQMPSMWSFIASIARTPARRKPQAGHRKMK